MDENKIYNNDTNIQPQNNLSISNQNIILNMLSPILNYMKPFIIFHYILLIIIIIILILIYKQKLYYKNI